MGQQSWGEMRDALLYDIILYSIIFRSRDSVLRGGSCIRIRDTRQCGYPEVHHTELRRRIRVGGVVGRKRRLDLQTVYGLWYTHTHVWEWTLVHSALLILLSFASRKGTHSQVISRRSFDSLAPFLPFIFPPSFVQLGQPLLPVSIV